MAMAELELIPACWTSAGACDPLGDDDRSPLPIRDRVEAAAEAGFVGFGIRHGDLLVVEEELGFPEFRKLLDAQGLRHLELEFLEGWYSEGEVRAKSDAARKDLLRAAEQLGPTLIKVGAHLAGGTLHVEKVAEEFSILAEQAQGAGTIVGLEPMPFADIRTPLDGLAVVRTAGHRAGGLFLDVWHVERAGVDVASLADIPSEYIVGVELDDADAEIRGTLLEDTINSRRFPGEGVLDVQGFVDAVRKTGYSGTWGVEMLSTEFRRLPLLDALRRAHDTTTRFLTTNPDQQETRHG